MPQVAKLIGDLTAGHDAPKQYRAGYTLDGDNGNVADLRFVEP